MIVARTIPPYSVDTRRPALSVRRKAGIELRQITIAETPEARKEDLDVERPAWWKRRGAYCFVIMFQLNARIDL
jgi:hypothetical protein